MITISFYRVMFVLIVTILAIVTASYAVRGAEATYDADVKILVGQPQVIGSTVGGSSLSKILQLLPTYVEMVYSYSIAEKVVNNLPFSVTPQEVQGSLSAKQITQTQILVITGHQNDPEKAKAIATAGSQALIDTVKSQQSEAKVKPEDDIVFSILEPANLAQANPPHKTRTIALAAIAALLVSVGAVIVFDNARQV